MRRIFLPSAFTTSRSDPMNKFLIPSLMQFYLWLKVLNETGIVIAEHVDKRTGQSKHCLRNMNSQSNSFDVNAIKHIHEGCILILSCRSFEQCCQYQVTLWIGSLFHYQRISVWPHYRVGRDPRRLGN